MVSEPYGYRGWPANWGGPYMWGSYHYLIVECDEMTASTDGEKAWDPNLRSTHDVSGHHIETPDGKIGHVEDFIIDDWWPGEKVLVSPQWIERVSWSDSKVFVNLYRETIKQSPEYTEESLPTREYETGLHHKEVEMATSMKRWNRVGERTAQLLDRQSGGTLPAKCPGGVQEE